MPNPTLSFDDFINKGATDAAFLRTYVRDPQRLSTRFDVAPGLIEKIKTEQALLEAIANSHPKKLPVIAKKLYGSDPLAAFGDHRDSNSYSDRFSDNASDGGFVDRFDDVH